MNIYKLLLTMTIYELDEIYFNLIKDGHIFESDKKIGYSKELLIQTIFYYFKENKIYREHLIIPELTDLQNLLTEDIEIIYNKAKDRKLVSLNSTNRNDMINDLINYKDILNPYHPKEYLSYCINFSINDVVILMGNINSNINFTNKYDPNMFNLDYNDIIEFYIIIDIDNEKIKLNKLKNIFKESDKYNDIIYGKKIPLLTNKDTVIKTVYKLNLGVYEDKNIFIYGDKYNNMGNFIYHYKQEINPLIIYNYKKNI